MSVRTTLFPIILLICCSGWAQVSDDFSDGDFSTNPEWSGDVSEFQIIEGRVQSIGPSDAASTLYLSTESSILNYTSWEFLVDLNFNGTNTNFIQIYLISDRSNLEDNPSGYFIRIGETNADYLRFYRSDAGSITQLAQGVTGLSSSTIGEIRIKVIRDQVGQWTVYMDPEGGQLYNEELVTTDNLNSSSSHFGFTFQYSTTSRFDDFAFDDIYIDQLEIDSVAVQSNIQLQIDFNQPVAQSDIETIGNYFITDVTLTSVAQDALDPSKVTLTLDPSTPLTTNSYTLTVASTLTKNEPTTYDFDYQQLELIQILTLSETELEITFNSDLDQATAETFSNYTIDNAIGQPTSATLDASDHKKVNLLLSNSLFEATTFQLTLSGLENASGNSSLSGSQDFTFVIPLIIDTVYATSERSCLVEFNKSLNESIAETVSNYTLNGGIGSPSSATLQADGKSVALEFASNFEDATYALTINNLEDLDANVIATNSTDTFDYLNLAISSLSQEGTDGVYVIFNQDIDEGTIGNLSNYSLSEIGEPTTVELVSSNHLLLTWNHLFNSAYELSITGLSNTAGNSSPGQLTGSVSIGVATNERHLIINEFLADPTPSVGLPEVEFVELYNPTDYSIELNQFTLDGQSIEPYQLPGKGYVVLVDNSDVSSFSIDNIVGISSMGALTNTSDAIVLKDQYGNLIDSINYVASEWYNDDIKNDGGYSLERVDPLQPCSDENNWMGSNDESGGTPGEQNSVFNDEDVTAPQLVSIEVIGGNTLSLSFSEPIDENSIATNSFVLDGFTFNSIIQINYSAYYLVLSSDLTSEVTHQLIIEGISDCRGNELTSQSYEFYYDVQPPVLDRIDLLSETELILVFNEPILESSAENESNFAIDGLVLDRATLQDSATTNVHLEFDDQFSIGAIYTLSYENLLDTLKNESLVQSTEFTFTSDIDTLWVETPNVLVLNYNKEPSASASNINNYYLGSSGLKPDTIIHKNDLSITEFRLSFAENFTENREMKLYITNVFANDHEARLATPASSFQYDTRAPSIDEVVVQNDSQIVVVFNEAVDSLSALKSSNYLLDGTDQPSSVVKLSSDRIQLNFQVKFVSEHILSIQRLRDLSGNEMSATRRISFVYDVTPPTALTANQISPNQIEVWFDEPVDKTSALTLTNYSLEDNEPYEVKMIGPDSLSVQLTFNLFDELADAGLAIQNIQDRYGNISLSQSISVNTLQPRMVSVLGRTKNSLLLIFSQSVSEANVLTNYSLQGYAIESIKAQDDRNYELIINGSFADLDSLRLSVENIIGTNDASLQSFSIQGQFKAGLEDYGFLNDRVIYLDFENNLKGIAPTNFEVIGHTISLVSWDSEDKSLVRLTLTNDIDTDVTITVQWNDLTDIYNRSFPDFEVGIFNDKTAPYYVRHESEFYGKVDVTFSEVMDPASLLSVNKYFIEGIGHPKFAILENDSTVTLDFDNQLVSGEDYLLKLSPLADLAGNLSTEENINLTYQPPAVPTYGEIIFTEIMTDPSPTVGLPEVEYLEIYNNSSTSYDLRGLIVLDESSEASLPSYVLGPSEYVLIVDEQHASFFEVENILEIVDFPSLTNAGEHLAITTLFGDLVDSLTYRSDWYGDLSKDDGGYSLELIDPNGGCIDSQNWRVTMDESGGTPGAQNSVYREGPDGIAPVISGFIRNNSGSFMIQFNEAMDSLSLTNTTFYISGYPVDELLVSGVLNQVLTVNLRQELPQGNFYSIEISGPQDCSGTLIMDTTLTIGLGKQPLPGELKITEIMADPDPSVDLPAVEYVEIYNNSSAPISLDNVRFRDSNSSRLIGDVVLADSAYVVLMDEKYVDSFLEIGVVNVIGLEDWPALNNSGEMLSLATDLTIDEVAYDDDWYRDPEKKAGGYSLERINPNGECSGISSWDGSQDTSGGTPGVQNSIYNDGPDAVKPAVLSFEVLDSRTLRFTFNEVMDSLSLANAYIEGATVSNRTVSGEDFAALTVDLLVPIVADEVRSVIISGATDCSGNSMEPASFEVAIGVPPTFNELIISEIMFDPDPVIELPSAEYLELYNRSDKLLSLQGVTLMDEKDTVELPAVTIRPLQYMVVCPVSRVSDFGDDINVTGLTGWRALDNGGEQLKLIYQQDLIFEITFEQSWHQEAFLDGGVSLEMKDLNNPCGGEENWTSSTSPQGGTPGKTNAASEGVPDNFGPNLISVRAINESVIELVFDELLGINSPRNTVLKFNPNLVVRTITFSENRYSLLIYLEDNLVKNQPIDIEVFGTVDCLANPVKTNKASVVLTDEVSVGDIVLNELLFNPRSEGVDFIEVLNTSSKYLDLYGWKPGNVEEDGSATFKTINEHYILEPGQPVAITTDTLILKNQYPLIKGKLLEVESVPSMNNDEGNVLISDASDNVLDQFTYNEDYHLSFLESVDGVSLERIDPKKKTQDRDNWTSASSAVGFATPGALNSQQYDVPLSTATLSIEPKIFVPGNRSIAHQSFTTINYQLDQPGQLANVIVYNQMGQPVADLAKGESLGTSGFFRWDGTSFGGSIVRRGYYVVLFELYDAQGNSQTLKETVVVGK